MNWIKNLIGLGIFLFALNGIINHFRRQERQKTSPGTGEAKVVKLQPDGRTMTIQTKAGKVLEDFSATRPSPFSRAAVIDGII